MAPVRLLKYTELNEHLVCSLCNGYFVKATTIAKCMHTFCKSCIVRYLETSSFCPMCDVQIHKTNPLLALRDDETLQELVYKLIPGVFATEVDRRNEFYKDCSEEDPLDTFQSKNRYYYSSLGEVSLSLEYLPPAHVHAHALGLMPVGAPSPVPRERKKSLKPNFDGNHNVIEEQFDESSAIMDFDDEFLEKRYLKCPTAMQISHLEKFIRMKYGLSVHHRIDLVHSGESLDSDMTLLDVLYRFQWIADTPFQLSYTVVVSPTYQYKRKAPQFIDYSMHSSYVNNCDKTVPSKKLKIESCEAEDCSKYSDANLSSESDLDLSKCDNVFHKSGSKSPEIKSKEHKRSHKSKRQRHHSQKKDYYILKNGSPKKNGIPSIKISKVSPVGSKRETSKSEDKSDFESGCDSTISNEYSSDHEYEEINEEDKVSESQESLPLNDYVNTDFVSILNNMGITGPALSAYMTYIQALQSATCVGDLNLSYIQQHFASITNNHLTSNPAPIDLSPNRKRQAETKEEESNPVKVPKSSPELTASKSSLSTLEVTITKLPPSSKKASSPEAQLPLKNKPFKAKNTFSITKNSVRQFPKKSNSKRLEANATRINGIPLLSF